MPETLRILLIEDDANDAFLVRRELRTEAVSHVTSLAEAASAIGLGGHDLVLLDLNLPDGSGLECLSAVLQSGAIPIVVLTGHSGPEIAEQAVSMGAADFVTKGTPVRPAIKKAWARWRSGLAALGDAHFLGRLESLSHRVQRLADRVGG